MTNEPTTPEANVVIKSLTVRHFRGFNDEITLPLEGSAVIVSGPNGRGKTSLFDAIQWLMLGRIPRLEELKLRAAEEHIVNQYAPAGSRAYVSAELASPNGGSIATVSRRGDRKGTVLEVKADNLELAGNDAEAWLRSRVMSGGRIRTDRKVSEEDFRRSFLTAGLLQQDDVRAFLSSSSPSERFETLSQMLGLAVLGEFVEALAGTESRLRDILNKRREEFQEAQLSVDGARGSLEEARARISAAPSVQDTDRQFQAEQDRLGVHLQANTQDDNPIRHYESMIATTGGWQSSLRVLESTFIAIQNHLATRPSEPLPSLDRRRQEVAERAMRLTEARDEAIEALTQAEATWVDARARGEALEALASAALPLLTDYCPVCTQAIEEASVRQRLEQILSANPELSHAVQTHHEAREHADSLRTQAAEAERLLQEVDHQRTTASVWDSELESLVAEARGNASSLESLRPPVPAASPDTGEVQIPRDFESWFVDTRSTVQQLQAAARTALSAHQALQEGMRVESLESRLSIHVATLSDAEASVASAQATVSARHDLVELARQQSTKVVEEIFTELAPVVQDVFARLAPHPTFDELSFSHDVFRRQGTSMPVALDRMTGTAINPALVFSSAQANVAALCYFIGLAFASSESDFGFVLMDDPLQSMDDVNVLGFSDLCRFLRREKQVIVSSHEARLTNLLRRKLSPRNEPLRTIVIDFVSWNRSGPNINIEMIGPIPESAVLASVQ